VRRPRRGRRARRPRVEHMSGVARGKGCRPV